MRVPLTLACGDYDRTHPLACGATRGAGEIDVLCPARVPRSFTDGRRRFGDPRGAAERKGLIKEPRSPVSLFAAGTREAFVI